ncbi:hypothetical protein X739_04200 [Mesorhizobium sp. LNHC220B00]|nr:hypothetical protein [Mesorhizobium sp. LNHC220B00]ESY89123.1 hypothetical protein X739_04200 [Mesorhizobium sp. LNHC220B00]
MNNRKSFLQIARLRRDILSELLDSRWRILGTPIRFGMDALVGPVPVLGMWAGYGAIAADLKCIHPAELSELAAGVCASSLGMGAFGQWMKIDLCCAPGKSARRSVTGKARLRQRQPGLCWDDWSYAAFASDAQEP